MSNSKPIKKELKELRVPLELTEDEKAIVERFQGEMKARLGVPVIFLLYEMEFLISPRTKSIYIEIGAGNHHITEVVSSYSLMVTSRTVILYYTISKLCDRFFDYLLKQAVKP